MTRFALLIEGRVPETVPECGARCGVLRLRFVTAPREVRDTARQALRPSCEELAARAAEEMLQTEARPPAGKSPRWSAERRASYVISAFTRVLRRTMGRRVPRKHPARRVMCGPTGCRRIRAPVGAPPTPRRWDFISPPGRHRAAGTDTAV